MACKDGRERLIKVVWHSIARVFCAVFGCGLCRVRAYGMKNIPRKGAVLVLCNHQSFFDPFFSQSWLIRHFHFVAREDLFGVRILGCLLKSLFVIPIKRGEGDIAAMRAIMAKLKAGCAVCLYPEGTRTSDGRVGEAQAGFGLLSRKTNAPIVPAVIEGAFEVWPRSRKWPRPRKVCVMYGEAISVEEVKRLGDREFARVLTEKLRRMHNELRQKMGREPFDYSGDRMPREGQGE